MSVPLHTHGKAVADFEQARIGRITRRIIDLAREDHVLLLDELAATDHRAPFAWLEGWAAVLALGELEGAVRQHLVESGLPAAEKLRDTSYLAEGDIVALQPTGYVRTLYRRGSPHNAVFATDRCNSFCLMCSQPPRPSDDRGHLAELVRLVDLIDPDCHELGITGGEPTLLGEDLVRLLAHCRDRLPVTGLHVLSNGRRFRDRAFATAVADVGHPDLMFGIPLYSALPAWHDYVVQAAGAWDETVLGLLELGRVGVAVEIRIVVHRQTTEHLASLADFIYRNLPFASHVAFMGLEMMGFAVPNRELLWIDPWDYRHHLEDAVLHLAYRGMNVSVYNHPLCLVPRTLWPYARRSISDWKNDYAEACSGCQVRQECGGFFTSTLRRGQSAHIEPILDPTTPADHRSPAAAGATPR